MGPLLLAAVVAAPLLQAPSFEPARMTSGGIGEVRARGGEGSPFADAAVASARQWAFRSALRSHRPVRGYVYVVFSFPQPVI